MTKDILDSGGLYSHPGHYSYSDMTGIVARSITSKTGMWTVVHDSGSAGESWGTASWNASEPAGTAVRVKVRSSEDKAAWSAWEDASSGTPLTSIPDGRYLQLQVTLQIASGKTSPILYDLTVQPASQPPENEAPTVVVGGPSVSVAEGQVAAASGTWGDPDGDPVSLSASVGTVVKNAAGTWSWSYATTDGPADSQKVTITADDGKGGTASAQFQLVVANVAPSVSAGPARTIVAGETYTGAGSFADPGADSPWTATVDYGDGAGPVSLTVAADKAFALSHVYASTGGYTITVKVTDKDGAAGTATASVTVNPPPNRPPALTVIGPLVSVNEGQTATNSGTWNDPDGDVVTLSASVGTVVKNAAGTWSWSYATRDGTAESQTVTLTADDGRGGISTASFALAVLNVAPSVTVPASSSVPEGSPFSASGSFSDPGADTWTATVDYGDGSGVQTLPLKGDRTFALLHEYVGNGDYTITVKVSDDDGGVGSGVAAVTVTNVSPSVSMPTAGSAAEGSQFAVAGCFSHPGAGSTCTATVDYGDGSGVQSLALGADKSFRLAHTYAQNGAYAAKVRVTDKDGASGTAQVTVNVANVAPSVGPISAPADPVGTAVVVSCSSPFTDPGTSDTHTAVWSWGDGTASAGAVSEAAGSGNVTGSHTYAATGVYSVSLTVSDADGGSGTASYDFIVVYDPTSGFVTGGGWIASPAGANASKPAFAGKASFGFVSKYFKKATNPRGDTRFVLHGAAFDFKAKAYDSLTVAGALAQYAGSGTVNGAQGYGFLVSVLDGQAAGGGGTDKFRLKIWDAKTRAVIYDTQSGAADTAAPTTLLGGGSIVIHD